MKIAVIGSGISGITCAHYLSKSTENHHVDLFECNDYVGGHTDTHDVLIKDKLVRVDTGFIVFNYDNYPNFTQFINDLKVDSIPTTMSFSVHNVASGLEYNATNLDALFCQRKNLLNLKFYKMLHDIFRFYREAPEVLKQNDTQETLGEYLKRNKYSRMFVNEHIIPMACALWSGPSTSIESFPVKYFVSFMQNHKMLNIKERPQWRVIKHGSRTYVEAFLDQFCGTVYTKSPIESVRRLKEGVELSVNGSKMQYDKVIIATHSDQALAMLTDATDVETQVLGDIEYEANHVTLHTDTSVLPKNVKAWACWNARVDKDLESHCTVSYHMNQLQSLDTQDDFITSLNSKELISPDKILSEREYMHPIYTQKTLDSQARWLELVGQNNHTYFCGAYWGWGFHEDGVNSALRIIDTLTKG